VRVVKGGVGVNKESRTADIGEEEEEDVGVGE
jgi:hypothetical protein